MFIVVRASGVKAASATTAKHGLWRLVAMLQRAAEKRAQKARK